MNSCHKEEELESIDTQTAIKKRTISFEQLNTKLNKYKKYRVYQGRAGGDEFITSLEIDNIVEIETEDKTTYTLKANTTGDDETNFTNIIFVEKNGELEKLLIQYEPTSEWKTEKLTNPNILYSGNTKLLDFEGNLLSESQIVDGITVSRYANDGISCYSYEAVYEDDFGLPHLIGYQWVKVECIAPEPENDEIDAGDSGDGGGADTGGDDGDGSTTSGTGTDGDNGDNSNDNETGDTADTGNDGEPVFTELVIGDSDANPEDCIKIQAQLDDFIFKQKYDELKALTGETDENGNYETNEDLFIDTPATPNGLSVYNLSVSLTKGYMHTHVNHFDSNELDSNGYPKIIQPIKIFSPRDIIFFLKIAKNSSFTGAVNTNEVYGMVITSRGSYTIRFNGDASNINLNFSGMRLGDKYKKRMEYNNLEKGLLLFLRDDMNVEGISLYRIKNNETIKEIRLKPNGSIERLPCS